MGNKSLHTTIIEMISALLIVLFVYTGMSKFLQLAAFQENLRHFPVAGLYAAPVARLLPAAELATALLLAIPNTKEWGLTAALLMLGFFTFYTIYLLLFVPHLPCSCGGMLEYLTWKQHLLFNSLFSCLSAIGLLLYRKNKIFIAINRLSRTPV